ncbi:hypothetical protein MUB42_01420 [Apilactobacillus kunkeei]|nr:hypothetical protein MUB42_01420 [Apilactobacillus kunkeei]
MKYNHSAKLKANYNSILSIYNSKALSLNTLNYKKKKVQKYVSLSNTAKKEQSKLKGAKSSLTSLKKNLNKHNTKKNRNAVKVQAKVVAKINKAVNNKVKSLNTIKKTVVKFKL